MATVFYSIEILPDPGGESEVGENWKVVSVRNTRRSALSDEKHSLEPGPPRGEALTRRIETQIHRRKKGKAVLPLEVEWEVGSLGPPSNLRMPADRMNKRESQACHKQ